MSKISLKDNMLIVKEGMGKYISLPLDELRLLYIFFPGNFKWYVVASSQNIDEYNLDSLPEDAFYQVTAEFKERLLKERSFILKDVKLCLADYANHSAVISLNDVKKCKVDLFDKLLFYRKPRVDKLNQWMTTYPEVRLEGGLGAKAFVNKEGFRKGDNKFITLNQVGNIQIVEKNFGLSDLLIIPQGVSSGMYSLKKYRYSLGNISTKKRELYLAECNFWRIMEEKQEDIPGKIKELSQLKEQGILSEEKFDEAKKKLLTGI
jgi:hypothetical protein